MGLCMAFYLWQEWVCDGIKFVPIRSYIRLTKSWKNLYCINWHYSQNEKNLIIMSELVIQNEIPQTIVRWSKK